MKTRGVRLLLVFLLPCALLGAGLSLPAAHASTASSAAGTHWSIRLIASATTLRIGGVVTLGVRAPAAAFTGNRRVYLENVSQRQIIRVCSRSTGLDEHSCIAQDQEEVPASRDYEAFIARTGKKGLQVLAHSAVVRVVWHAAGTWAVTLTVDGNTRITVASGTSLTLRAVSSRALGGEYSLEIRARGCIPGENTCIRGGILVTTCYRGTVCTATVSSPAEGGTTEKYRATVLGPAAGGSGVVAKSKWVTVRW